MIQIKYNYEPWALWLCLTSAPLDLQLLLLTPAPLPLASAPVPLPPDPLPLPLPTKAGSSPCSACRLDVGTTLRNRKQRTRLSALYIKS